MSLHAYMNPYDKASRLRSELIERGFFDDEAAPEIARWNRADEDFESGRYREVAAQLARSGLSTRVANVLVMEGIRTKRQYRSFVQWHDEFSMCGTYNTLLKFRNMGKIGVYDLNKWSGITVEQPVRPLSVADIIRRAYIQNRALRKTIRVFEGICTPEQLQKVGEALK